LLKDSKIYLSLRELVILSEFTELMLAHSRVLNSSLLTSSSTVAGHFSVLSQLSSNSKKSTKEKKLRSHQSRENSHLSNSMARVSPSKSLNRKPSDT